MGVFPSGAGPVLNCGGLERTQVGLSFPTHSATEMMAAGMAVDEAQGLCSLGGAGGEGSGCLQSPQ